MPAIGTPAPDPVPVDPDIVCTRRNRPLVIDIRRLIGDIALDLTAGHPDTTSYYYEH
jgi:hypothetical protein